ncbi:hypothetical protein [Salinigranum salinum]|nr:hypothetical protein [Salinigranum salinum]
MCPGNAGEPPTIGRRRPDRGDRQEPPGDGRTDHGALVSPW